MTHLLLSTLVACPLHAGLSLPVIVIANVVVVADTTGAAVDSTDNPAGTPFPLQTAISSTS